MKYVVCLITTLLLLFSSLCYGETYLVKWRDNPDHPKAHVYKHILNGKLAKMDLTADEVDDLYKRGLIEYAEGNIEIILDAIPNDPMYGQLWGMIKIMAPSAWDITTGSSQTVVGIIDTGINYIHPDLAANVWINPGEIPGDGIDNDGNGYVDDYHGINSVFGTGDPMDDDSHGSHCSGTIGATGNNGIGVAGVNWNVQVMMCRFWQVGSSGGILVNSIGCLDYFSNMRNRGIPVSVISISWGGGYSQALYDVMESLPDLLFICAAGNTAQNADIYPHYPAAFDLPNVMSIAATTQTDELAYFSTWGPMTVDMGAPGYQVLSTVLGEGYEAYSGTSMATPHVAGAAGLLLSVEPDLTPAELKQRLMDTGDPIPALDDKTVSGKRLNVFAVLGGVEPPPPPPPPCEPYPSQTRTISCPRPYRGYMTQTRISMCPGPTWGPWLPQIGDTCYKGKRK